MGTAPTLSPLFEVVANLGFVRYLSSEEISGLLLRVEIVPFGIQIVIFVERGEISSSVLPVIVLIVVPIVLVPSLLVIPISVVVSSLLLEWTVCLGLSPLDALRQLASLLGWLLCLLFFIVIIFEAFTHEVVQGVPFSFIFASGRVFRLLLGRDEKITVVNHAVWLEDAHVQIRRLFKPAEQVFFGVAFARSVVSDFARRLRFRGGEYRS